MKFTVKFLTLIFAMFLFIGIAATDASAQRRGGRRIYRPVIVRQYYYNPYWYLDSWRYDSFYNPYLSERRQRYYLQNELCGNREELRKHLEKYNADGIITAKEREELNDDYRDVRRSELKLKDFDRRY
jgi:hypothetical protein